MKQFDTAIIIAGGKSIRMGFDKAFMKIGKTTCIELIVQSLKRHFNEIVIVADEPDKYNFLKVNTTHDQIKNAGPLGGLHAGLKISSSIYNYLIACDMPILSDDLIIYMKSMLFLTPEIIACDNNGFIEPFHAVYSKNLTKKIEQEFKIGEHSLFNLMQKSKTEIITDIKIKKICGNTNIYTNLNTRRDLERFMNKKVESTGECHARS